MKIGTEGGTERLIVEAKRWFLYVTVKSFGFRIRVSFWAGRR